jgi:hypothetical protein
MRRSALPLAALLLLLAAPARAWWPHGHDLLARAAARALPDDTPEFFRRAAPALALYSLDADLFKDRDLPALRAAESPEHYLDLELLRGRPLPATRPEYRELCARLRVDPDKAGCLPYAILEAHDRLALAFAAWRKTPDDPRARARVLYIAGHLAHYTADAAQPLHTTIHFDGRARPDGSSPRSGIHNRIDNLIRPARLTPERIAETLEIAAPEDIFAEILATLARSHARVDTVYKLEPLLPPLRDKTDEPLDPRVAALALDAAREGARLTATVWYSAWRRSASLRLPSWYKPDTP